jgi:hypothetical protein
MFTTQQRDSIFRAYEHIATVREATLGANKKEMDKATAPGTEKNPKFDERKGALQATHDARMKSLAGTMGRLGLLLGLLGDKPRSTSAFATALKIDRMSRDVWLQYAQMLTALGDDAPAKAIFDWLLTNPAEKLPPPGEVAPKNGNGNGVK